MVDVSIDASTLRSVSADVRSAASSVLLDGAVARASETALGSAAAAEALQGVVNEQVLRAELASTVLTGAAAEPAAAVREFEQADRFMLGPV